MSSVTSTTQTTAIKNQTAHDLAATTQSAVTVIPNSFFLETLTGFTDIGNKVPFLIYPYKLIVGKVTNEAFVAETNRTFTLPITPQQLNISTPFAIVTTPTLNGVVEEHNSTRFRDIEIAGTMGVMPARGKMDPLELDDLRGALNASGVVDTGLAVAQSFPLLSDLFKRKNLEPSDSPAYTTTGYRNIHSLRNLLEKYAEDKKSDPSLRLVFANYKDNQLYYVTPVSFVVRRSAENPLEYQYQLALKAWGRFGPNDKPQVSIERPTTRTNVLSTILSATTALSTGIKALGSVLPYANSFVLGAANTALSSIAGLGSALRTTVNSARNITSGYENIYAGVVGLANMQLTGDQVVESTNTQQALDRTFTPRELNDAANSAKNTSLFIADTLGLKSFAYDLVNERTPAPTKVAQPTPEQIDSIFQLNTITNSLNSLATDEMMREPENVSPMEYVAGLASRSGIAFQVPVSKFPVPFPYGPTLEHLAAQYLGDPNRWIEIATLNGLQEPYIDHVGYDVKLLTNGYANKVTIGSRSVVKLQPVVLFSDASQSRKTFTVIDIQEISPSVFEVTLDNDVSKLDLSFYKTSERAYLHAYAPNTVHAGQTIYIPSQEAVSDINDFNSSTIPSLKQYDELVRVSGVDLLLTSSDVTIPTSPTQKTSYGKATSMDLLLDPTSGDVMLAGPEAMLIQSLKLAIFTPLGSLLRHPNFGVGMPIGQSVADVNLDGFKDVIRKAILQDSSFSDVEFTEFSFKNGSIRIHLGVRVAQLNKLLPVSFDVNLRAS